MKRPRERSWNCCFSPAFTLVEVVASLMLLGTLLVGILAAHRRHAQQVHTAKARIDAITAADQLLSAWMEQGVWGATESSGRFDGRNDLVWRWTVLSEPELSKVGASIGRLEVFSTRRVDEVPLARVELVMTADGSIPAMARPPAP